MKRTRWYLPWTLLAGAVLLVATTEAARGTAVVLNKLKAKQDSSTTTSTGNPKASEGDEVSSNSSSIETSSDAPEAENITTKSGIILTGIPQLDYVHDPNLPHELNGYNLTNYPFFDRVPEVMDFACDGRLDGFYADVTYQCQVYHHCLYGTRHDFLCANFTAFDQRTFICHFASEVDCKNSHKYWSRNEPLYKATTQKTTTTLPTTTTVAPPPGHRRPAPGGARRRRPYRRRRPVYEYYYDDDDYEDDPEYYYDDPTGPAQTRSSAPIRPSHDNQRRRKRPQRPLTGPGLEEDDRATAPEQPMTDLVKPRVGTAGSVYDRPRTPPKVRRPVPVNERDKYNYSKNRPDEETTQATHARPSKTTQRPQSEDSEYYDDEEEYDPPAGRTTRPSRLQEHHAPTAHGDRDSVRRQPPTGSGRPLRRNQRPTSVRRRPSEEDEYEDSYEDEQPRRPAARPAPNNRKRVHMSPREQQDHHRTRQEAEYSSQRPSFSSQRSNAGSRYEEHSEQPVPAPRPAYISTTPRQSYAARKRPQQPVELPPSGPDYGTSGQRSSIVNDYKRPAAAVVSRKPVVNQPIYDDLAEDEEYYDDEEEEELPEEEPVNNSRPKQSNVRVAPSTSLNRQRLEEDRQPVMTSKRPFLYNNRVTTPRGTTKHQGSRVPVSAPGGDFNDDRSLRNTRPDPVEEHSPRTSADLLGDFKLKTSRPIADNVELRPVRTSQDDSLEDLSVRTSRPEQVETHQLRTSSQGRQKPEEDYRLHRHRDAATAPDVPQKTGYPHSHRDQSENPPAIQPSGPGGVGYRTKTPVEELPSAPGANYRRNPYGDPPSAPGSRNKNPPTYDSTAPRGNIGKYRPNQDILTDNESLEDEDTHSRVVQETIESPPSRGSVTFKPPHLTDARSTANPGSIRIPENIPIKQNLADISEDDEEFDESLNEALHPNPPGSRIIPTGNGFVYVPVSSPSSPQKPRVKVFKNKVGQQNYQSRYASVQGSLDPSATTARSNAVGSSLTGHGNLATSGSQRHVTRTPYRYKEADYVGATGKDLDVSEDYEVGEDVAYYRHHGRQGPSIRQQHRRIQPAPRDYASY